MGNENKRNKVHFHSVTVTQSISQHTLMFQYTVFRVFSLFLSRYILNYLRDGDLLYPDDQTAKEQLLKEAKFYQVQGIISYLEEALSPIHSSIIKDKNHVSTLLSWMSPGTTFSLLYCASVNGKNPGIFHRCCDKKGPTLLVIKSGEYIFGGYASKSWRSALSVRGIEDSKSFLFTLEGPSGSEPIRINPTPGAHGGIRCYDVIGPCFGTQRHYDLEVRGNFSATLDLAPQQSSLSPQLHFLTGMFSCVKPTN
ncbi:uncharacterized protein LOC111323957 isoform X2 [Stylophora pistillata]|uniref:uncharacterized protein LOC111323957 isoform X2 n=1 Tax=Stylophora pistillata TaxID=50429 RepID=UPI000C03D8D7|nr:uncharacterized protein LOC111323957 isoform X2 [Stylophora pistillata]